MARAPHDLSHDTSPSSLARKLKALDESRPSLPGEHWLVFAAGLWLMRLAGRRRSWLASTLTFAAGSALVGRAASGRDGPIRIASRLVGGRGR